MPIAYRYPAGAIGYAIETTEAEWGEPIPPLNALVVNETTGLPGKGIDYFIKNYLDVSKSQRSFTRADRQSIVEAIHQEIYNYTGWKHKLLKHYGLPNPPSLEGSSPRKLIEIRQYNWGGEAESEAHKRLKTYVCEHPELLDLPETVGHGVQEYVLPSSDKIDVLFLHDDWFLAVEVKAVNANDNDLRRGIFQCVKYRELLRAENNGQKEIFLAPECCWLQNEAFPRISQGRRTCLSSIRKSCHNNRTRIGDVGNFCKYTGDESERVRPQISEDQADGRVRK